jgi:hypothetical protein
MTVKEAVLKALENNKKLMSYKDIYEYIKKNNLKEFEGKTPEATISALLGDFIRQNDNRVKRIKTDKSTYLYYFSKYENEINFENYNNYKHTTINKNYKERSLHKLLSSFLNNVNIKSKTIYHEKSNKLDTNQKWIHPDMVGVNFLDLKSKINAQFLKTIDKQAIFKIYSYELKKEINTDYELKEAYFQTVSNSSWANYGYLVSYEINDRLFDEIQRLNESFGIGVIILSANPYQSKILYQSKYRNLDFKTIDKLSYTNKDFSTFIELIEKFLNANEKYIKGIKKEFEDFFDKSFESDKEILNYLQQNNIPFDKKLFEEG